MKLFMEGDKEVEVDLKPDVGEGAKLSEEQVVLGGLLTDHCNTSIGPITKPLQHEGGPFTNSCNLQYTGPAYSGPAVPSLRAPWVRFKSRPRLMR